MQQNSDYKIHMKESLRSDRMPRLPEEIIVGIIDQCDGRSLLNARLVNQQWRQLIDGHGLSLLSSSARRAQGKLAAEFQQLSRPSVVDASHPGHSMHTLLEHNAAWMQRDFASALRAALRNDHDLKQEPAFSFDLRALAREALGEEVPLADFLEPELHAGQLFVSYASSIQRSFGILHVDLNLLDPAQIQHLHRDVSTGRRSTAAQGPPISGFRRLSWPVPIQAWGFSKDTQELIIVCYHSSDPPYLPLSDEHFGIHVIDIETLRPSQPATTHHARHACVDIITLKIAENFILIGMAPDDDEQHQPEAICLPLHVLHLKPKVVQVMSLPQDAQKSQAQLRLVERTFTGKPDHVNIDWRMGSSDILDAAVLDKDLVAVVGSPDPELQDTARWSEEGDVVALSLDIYHLQSGQAPSLLVRQPILARCFSNGPFERGVIQEVKMSIEPLASSPIIMAIALSNDNRRDRVFLARESLLQAARQQIQCHELGRAAVAIMDVIDLKACTSWSTHNLSNMHTAHRNRFIGYNSLRDLVDELRGRGEFDRAAPLGKPKIDKRDITINISASATIDGSDGGSDGDYDIRQLDQSFFLTIGLALPAKHIPAGGFTAQQKRWLGIPASTQPDADHSSIVPRPLHGWVSKVIQTWSRDVPAGRVSHAGPNGWRNRWRKVDGHPDYLTVARIIDLRSFQLSLGEVHSGELMLDDDRLVLSLTRQTDGVKVFAVLPIRGPKLN